MDIIGSAVSDVRNQTAEAGTKEWLEASRNMVIVAYVDSAASVTLAGPFVDVEAEIIRSHRDQLKLEAQALIKGQARP